MEESKDSPAQMPWSMLSDEWPLGDKSVSRMGSIEKVEGGVYQKSASASCSRISSWGGKNDDI